MKYTGTYFGKTRNDFKSDEELFFWCWLKESESKKLVDNIKYESRVFELAPRASIEYERQLKTKTKVCDKFLFHKHAYTPDFEFRVIHDSLDQYFVNTAYLVLNWILVDVKGSFNQHGDPKQFSINQKWMYDKFDIYIQKIVPEKFFKLAFAPDIFLKTPKTGKLSTSKKVIGCKNIEEYMDTLCE
jgi:hypothetical protein